MDTMRAFSLGEANRGKEMKIFDWGKAARIIRDRRPAVCVAGLSSDMECTSEAIYCDGEPLETGHTRLYLGSTWTTPVLVLDGGEEEDCYVMKSDTEWGPFTVWPDSAKAILAEPAKKE